MPVSKGYEVGLYGSDIFNIASWCGEYGIDWFMFKSFRQHSVECLTDRLLDNINKLLPLFDSIKYRSDSSVVSDKFSKELFSFIEKECLVDIGVKKILNSPVLLKIIASLLCFEVINYLNQAVNPMVNDIGKLFKKAENESIIRIPLSTIIRNASYFLFNFSLKSCIKGFFVYGIANISRFFGYRSYIFDTYFFQLCRRLFVMIYFSRDINTLYKCTFISYMQKNVEEIKRLLYEYQEANCMHLSEKCTQIKKEIEGFVARGHESSFFAWIRLKTQSFIGTDALIETVLSLPLLYKVGTFALSFVMAAL